MMTVDFLTAENIEQLDAQSKDRIRDIIADYKVIRRTVQEVCEKYSLNAGIYAHKEFILSKVKAALRQGRVEHEFSRIMSAVQGVLYQMYFEERKDS